jgi:hypothetical protein
MKEIYLVSFLGFRKNEAQVITYAYAFSNEEEAIKFRDFQDEVACALISKHEVYETYEDALIKMVESSKKIMTFV